MFWPQTKSKPEADPYVLPAISEGGQKQREESKTKVCKLFLCFGRKQKANLKRIPMFYQLLVRGAKQREESKTKVCKLFLCFGRKQKANLKRIPMFYQLLVRGAKTKGRVKNKSL